MTALFTITLPLHPVRLVYGICTYVRNKHKYFLAFEVQIKNNSQDFFKSAFSLLLEIFTCCLVQKDTFPGLIYVYAPNQVYRHRENNFTEVGS